MTEKAEGKTSKSFLARSWRQFLKLFEPRKVEIVDPVEEAIRECEATKGGSLDLQFNGLKEVPLSVRFLPWLTHLDLSSNDIEHIPDWMGELTGLRSLNLSCNSLKAFPPEILRMTNLRKLDLRSNQIPSLPPEISNLKYLVELDAGVLSLHALPATIGQLEKLKKLHIDSNYLSDLPPELANAPRLKCIDLAFNRQIRPLPEGMGCNKDRPLHVIVGQNDNSDFIRDAEQRPHLTLQIVYEKDRDW